MITTMEVLTVNTSDIKVHQVIDECADLSYLGEYTNKHPGYDELKRGSAFDRKADGTMDGMSINISFLLTQWRSIGKD